MTFASLGLVSATGYMTFGPLREGTRLFGTGVSEMAWATRLFSLVGPEMLEGTRLFGTGVSEMA